MNNKRLLFLALIVATLSIGVIVGTIVSGGVKATALQKAETLALPDPVSLSNVFSKIAAQLEPAVVNINTEATIQRGPQRGGQGPRIFPQDPFGLFDDFFGDPNRPRTARNLGTGFIVDKAGYILTNHHVVDGADKIKVRLSDNSEYTAKLIGSDEETDLALIKIEAGRDLATAKFGNSDSVKVGDWVLAIGSPYDFDHTVTAGIISAVGREGTRFENGRVFQSFLQTDAAINPGNSGGPLVNMAGEVIGVNTAIVSQTGQFSGLGFALRSNTAIRVYNQLAQTGKVTRGYIGILPSNSDPRAFGVADGQGVVVDRVEPGSPAESAGIRVGDVITEIDGKKIPNPATLYDAVANTEVQKRVPIKVVRDGREQVVSVTPIDRESGLGAANNNNAPRRREKDPTSSSLGIGIRAINPQTMRQLELDDARGVVITSIAPGSVLEEKGVEPGMVITEMRVNGRVVPINSPEDFRTADSALKSGDHVAVRVTGDWGGQLGIASRFVPVVIP